MPRTASRGRRGFIWLPRTTILAKKITINGDDVTENILDSSFTKALSPDVGVCSIELLNADSAYANKYSQNQDIILYMDLYDPDSFAVATTIEFKGKIDSIKSKYSAGMPFTLMIEGSQSVVYDTTVTASYDGSVGIETIFNDILPSAFTLNYTATSTKKPLVNWDKNPFGIVLMIFVSSPVVMLT